MFSDKFKSVLDQLGDNVERYLQEKERDQQAKKEANRSMATLPEKLGKTYKLRINHVPTGGFVDFPAFLTGFSDAYNVNWNAEQVFGRSDPIATYQNTRRAISVSFNVVAASVNEARNNLNKVNILLTMLYPLYQSGGASGQKCGDATTVNMGPLLRIKFGNLIADASTGGPLLGYVNGFTMDPELEDGFFLDDGDNSMPGGETGAGTSSIMGTNGIEYIPKNIRLNFEMTVLHEHSLGWVKGPEGKGVGTGQKYYFRGGSKGFPYTTSKAVPTIAGENEGDAPDSSNNGGDSVEESEQASILQQIT